MGIKLQTFEELQHFLVLRFIDLRTFNINYTQLL